MRDEQEFLMADLLLRYMRDELSPAEESQLFSWMNAAPENKQIIDQLLSKEGYKDEYLFFQSIDQQADWKKLQRNIEYVIVPTWKRPSTIKYAAAILIIVAAAILLYLQSPQNDKRIMADHQENKPGRNKATLTLEDGTQISLNDAAWGTIAQQENITIDKTSSGQLRYRLREKQENTDQKVQINTITTPIGGQYQIMLADGSIAWLNAASSIKFPASFKNAAVRKVEITGEVFFNIKKDPIQPFSVICANQVVEVLGTTFNINAYPGELNIQTTLIDGAVKVKSGINTVNLKPGQKAVSNNNLLEIHSADTRQVTAWMKGDFMFISQELGSVMRSISRWYNVDVKFISNRLATKKFTGTISRYEELSEVLKILEFTDQVHFAVNGNKIIVSE